MIAKAMVKILSGLFLRSDFREDACLAGFFSFPIFISRMDHSRRTQAEDIQLLPSHIFNGGKTSNEGAIKSGFGFRKKRENINWRLLASISVEKIIREVC